MIYGFHEKLYEQLANPLTKLLNIIRYHALYEHLV